MSPEAAALAPLAVYLAVLLGLLAWAALRPPRGGPPSNRPPRAGLESPQ